MGLRNYRQRADETLWEYIQCFFMKHNELSNVMDSDVINAFIYGMACEVLVHALAHETPRTMKELLDVATQYATDKEGI
jgi:hypothetical protein